MPTAAERKAFLFLGVVAMLGATVRIWRSQRTAPSKAVASDTVPLVMSSAGAGGVTHAPDRGIAGRTSSSRTSRAQPNGTRSMRSRAGQIVRDSTSIIDIDRASVAEIDALGVLPAGMAHVIVSDRDTFGPFGSLDELKRVPFLTASTLRKLAPRVTFSLLPRPRNTVINPRNTTVSARSRGARDARRSAPRKGP